MPITLERLPALQCRASRVCTGVRPTVGGNAEVRPFEDGARGSKKGNDGKSSPAVVAANSVR
jgi:hypothetical protein